MAEEKKQPEKKEAAQAEEQASEKKAAPSQGQTWDGSPGVFGVKAGMTQVFNENGEALGVTAIRLSPNVITQVKTQEKNGYNGVQVAFGEKDPKKVSKSEKGHLKKSGAEGFYQYQEIRLSDASKLEGAQEGARLQPAFLKEGALVDLSSISKGKGFQGVMKRYHFSGGPASHGASIVHRMPGSIGDVDPSRVYKGRKMAGRMGHQKTSIQNVKVVRVDHEKGFVLVHGSVPGSNSTVVRIQPAVKRG